ncbi:hypothetical protein LTR85_011495 [Meristemomyces frigidus]|nr:hypothetical protein LTR85_011495 [Meristemomyces frigidus]
MAGDFLRSHGIDIDAEMHRIQHGGGGGDDMPITTTTTTTTSTTGNNRQIERIHNVSLPNTPAGSRWDLTFTPAGKVSRVTTSSSPQASSSEPSHPTQERNSECINGHGALLAPSLCHPHVHLDKAYLLSHPRYSDLQIERGDFAEAMELTGKAKASFTPEDLLERGQRLIDESVAAGVTHMRVFVELDAGVGMKCLEAGVQLKEIAESTGRCHVQICAFAQLPLFSPSQDDPQGEVIRGLMAQAAAMQAVDCVGSTPYVETSRALMEQNVEWMVALSKRENLHLDFHLDYNLDPETEPMVWHVVEALKAQDWPTTAATLERRQRQKTVALGHCTRLTLWPAAEWRRLAAEIADAELPIHFVGLPTSDLFMMRTLDRTRGTLDIPNLIKDHNLNACIGVNNIGNAFTPHGSADPLTLACNGVGIYQAGTARDAEVLYEAVSTRARAAIGLGRRGGGDGQGEGGGGDAQDGDAKDEGSAYCGSEVREGDAGDLVLFGAEEEEWRTRRSVAEAVYLYDHCRARRAFLDGKVVT